MKIHEAQMNGMKIEIVSSTIIVQNFDTLVPVMDIPIRQKISKEISDLSSIINQINETDIHTEHSTQQ